MVTAGPTYEAIDPVRFIGNHSSGKMGFALAEALYMQGADVLLITGSTHEVTHYRGLKIQKVISAAEMFTAADNAFNDVSIAVMSAAVADFTPEQVAAEKIKKKTGGLQLSLTRTKDILKHLGSNKKAGQYVVGFALETQHEKENALEKLRNKNADCIILNSLRDKEAGFGVDTNKVIILNKDGSELSLGPDSKKKIAEEIVSFIVTEIHV